MSRSDKSKITEELKIKNRTAGSKKLIQVFRHQEFLINLDHKEELKRQPSKQLTKRYRERHQDLFKMKSMANRTSSLI